MRRAKGPKAYRNWRADAERHLEAWGALPFPVDPHDGLWMHWYMAGIPASRAARMALQEAERLMS